MTESTLRHLLAERDLTVPAVDEPLLEAYWQKMRGLRARVDEDLLGDADIAVTWSATEQARR